MWCHSWSAAVTSVQKRERKKGTKIADKNHGGQRDRRETRREQKVQQSVTVNCLWFSSQSPTVPLSTELGQMWGRLLDRCKDVFTWGRWSQGSHYQELRKVKRSGRGVLYSSLAKWNMLWGGFQRFSHQHPPRTLPRRRPSFFLPSCI